MKLIYFLLFISPFVQAQNVQRKEIMHIPMEAAVKVVEVQEITFSKGIAAPAHLHPCTVLGYVISGKLKYQKEGSRPQVLKKGDYFLEPANALISHFDNISKCKKAKFIAIYLKENQEQANYEEANHQTSL